MADKWDWYRAAMKAKNAGADLPPVSEGKPEWGFYYAKASRDGGRIPVCIFADNSGEMVARSGTRDEHRMEDAGQRWSWVAGNPVDRSDYVYAWENNKWPDGTPTTAPALSAGSNLPTDPYERLMAEVTDKLASAEQLLNDTAARPDKTRADKARNIQSELLQLNRNATAMHATEKAPHLEAGRAVDAKFKFRDAVEATCKRLRVVFENIAKRLEAEANEVARREHEKKVQAAEAERRRIEAERQAKMRDDPVAALTDPEPELPVAPPPPEPVKVAVGGGIGRAAGLKTVWIGTIVDYQATLNHYRNHPKVQEIIDKLVTADVKTHKADAKIPGVKIRQERVAA